MMNKKERDNIFLAAKNFSMICVPLEYFEELFPFDHNPVPSQCQIYGNPVYHSFNNTPDYISVCLSPPYVLYPTAKWSEIIKLKDFDRWLNMKAFW